MRISRISGRRRPARGERGRQQDERRDERPDIRDEPPEEHDDRQRGGVRHAQDDQEQTLGDRIEGGDDRRPTEIAADTLQGDVAAGRDGIAPPVVGRRQRPHPRLVAIHHEEERQEGGQDGDRRDGGDAADDVRHGRRQPCLDAGRCPLDREPDLRWDRQLRKLILERGDTPGEGQHDLGDVRDERDGDEPDGREDDHAGGDEDRGRGLDPRPAAIAQGEHERGECRCHDGGHQDGRRHGREHEGDLDQDQDQCRHREHAPTDGCETLQPARNEV